MPRGARAPYDGVVALGCVIRGETRHFEIVATSRRAALMDLSVRERLPVGNGILTVETEAQAHARGESGRRETRAATRRVPRWPWSRSSTSWCGADGPRCTR